jgi:hypothetical protein
MAVWWVPWWQEVLGFLEAKRAAKTGVVDLLRQFTQKRRARFWTDDMADSSIEINRSSDYSKIDYENGELIEDEKCRFATIDAGGDHYWLMVTAWRQGGFCKILYEGYIPSDGGDEVAMCKLIDGYKVPRNATLIDIGFEQDRIADLCVKHGWRGVKGEGNKQFFLHPQRKGSPVEKLYSKVRRARAKSGGVAKFIFLASNPIKDILARMLANGDQIEMPADASKPLENHLKCERRTVEKHPKTGAEKPMWIRPGNKANHLWDCLYYAVGAALVMGVFDSE